MHSKALAAGVAGLGLMTMAASVHATELVQNGGFESLTSGGGQLGFNTDAVGWTTGGYNFVFPSGTADTTGVNGQYGNLQLWGPNNGSTNGLASSPDGGNFVAADGAFQVGAITQTLTGLTQGAQYNVSFWWAGAQQKNFNGATTEQWVVGFGGDPTQATSVVNNADHGFTGWMHETFTFTADGTSDVLSFLAQGTPTGEPPFSLLDGVSVTAAAVPEPAGWALMILGVASIGAMARSRRRALAAA